jgi:hypothetical protein
MVLKDSQLYLIQGAEELVNPTWYRMLQDNQLYLIQGAEG